MKKFLLLVLILGIVVLITRMLPEAEAPTIPPEEKVEEPIEIPTVATSSHEVIGQSVEGREIESFTFGTGATNLLFIGGIHGGYEWNSILLAYEMIDHFSKDGSTIPDNVTVHIIPNLNPDGLFLATGLTGKFTANDITDNSMHSTGLGRMNANGVDLNRNFDCKWQPNSTWRSKKVSAGTNAFSEPEAVTLRDYVFKTSPKAVVLWHSQAGNVYGSECENGILPNTITLLETYASASDYGEVPIFDAYPVTGDAEGWLASIGIPAVTVEMKTRTTSEWEANLAGTMAVLESYNGLAR